MIIPAKAVALGADANAAAAMPSHGLFIFNLMLVPVAPALFFHGVVGPIRLRAAKVQLCASAEEPMEASTASSLHASLHKRRSELSARTAGVVRERELIAALSDLQPMMKEHPQAALWQHWYGEEGESARNALHAAEGEAEALTNLIEAYPDWAEPMNRLATLRYMEEKYFESVELCFRILRLKPWHFGASSGIVWCFSELAQRSNVINRDRFTSEAERWSKETLPFEPGPEREEWVQRMLVKMDAKLATLREI